MPQFEPVTSTFSRSDSAIICAIKNSRWGTAAGPCMLGRTFPITLEQPTRLQNL